MMRFHGLYHLGIIAVGLAASLVWVDDASGCRHRRHRRAGCHGGGYTYAAPACGSYYGGNYYGNGYAPYGNPKGYDVAPPAPGDAYGPPPTTGESVTPPDSAATRGALETETRSFSDQSADVPPEPPVGESTQPIESQVERAADENATEESTERAVETTEEARESTEDVQETIEAPADPQ
jgi:hypothetical protein